MGGFSPLQLGINYAAFVVMTWLLLGVCLVQQPRPGLTAVAGALLYGAAFTYFAHTALYALREEIATYDALWARLGLAYTVHGAVMIVGGALFALSALRAGWLPRFAVLLFLAGLLSNLVIWMLPAPDILQTVGSALRNAGIVGMGYAVLRSGLRVGQTA